jgi:hypothetical protein
MKRNRLIAVMVAYLLVIALIGAATSALAQNYPFFGYYVVSLCSTTDYDAIAAKALNMASSDLRTALVSGQFLEDIAASQNVTPDTVKQALLNAHFAEIDQAVSDGLLDSQQAKQLKTLLTNAAPIPPRPPVPYANGLPPDITAYNFQAVKVLIAAAHTLDLKCTDLVKAMQNHSLVALTTSRGGQIGAVIDAMIKAYQDALDQDVKEQLITAAQSKGLRVQLAGQVTSLVNQAGQPVLMQILTLPGFGTGAAFPPNALPYLAGATGANPSAAGPLTPAHAPGQS